MTTSRPGSWTSPARAGAGLVILAAALILPTGNALAAVGDITVYPLPNPANCPGSQTCGPFAIAAGPDGNLWFTEDNGTNVAKVTTSGGFTEYPIPTATCGSTGCSSRAEGIVAGPDGNLWFTEADARKGAEWRTTGVVSEYD